MRSGFQILLRETRARLVVAAALLCAVLLLTDVQELQRIWTLINRTTGEDDETRRLRLRFTQEPHVVGELAASYTVNDGDPKPVTLRSTDHGRAGTVVISVRRTDRVTAHTFHNVLRRALLYCEIRDVDTSQLIDDNQRFDDFGSVRCYYNGVR